MSTLKKKISTFMKQNDLNTASFCRKSVVNPAAIHNILKSENPNPTIETVIEISKIMGCSLDDLFEFDLCGASNTKVSNPDLMKSVCNCICETEEIKNLPMSEYYQAIKHVYEYCLENKLVSADKSFAGWYLRNKKNINIM